MRQGELLRDHAAHGDPEDVRIARGGGIQHRCRIICHQRQEIRPGRRIAQTHAAIIKDQNAVMRRQRRQDAEPHLAGIAQPHDQQEGIAVSRLRPVQSGSVSRRRVRHIPVFR